MVLDASAVVEWLLGLPHADTVAARIAEESTLHAPHLLTVEVAQVLRRYVRRGDVTSRRGSEALGDLADLDVVHHPHEPLLPLIWRYRDNLTAYDATYIALAEVLDRPLLTLDAALAGVGGHAAVVELVR